MIEVYKNSVDGILLLTTFPCGPDSLVNEMIISKIKKPLTTYKIPPKKLPMTNDFKGKEYL